jgi:glucuronoarabinoxylan endo-1,4-beta-xylanase
MLTRLLTKPLSMVKCSGYLWFLTFFCIVAASPTANAQTKYEAETATLVGPSISTSYTGYSGTGYADYVNSTGEYIEFTLSASSAGTYPITFRYANGTSTNRPLELRVNGAVVISSMNFPGTGSWTTWVFSATNNVTFNAGVNTIRLSVINSHGGNVDYMLVTSSGTQSASLCDIDWNDTKQHIDGFGFSSAWCGTLSAAKNTSLYDTLGLSLLRIRIDPNQSWGDERNNAAAAHSRGLKVLGTPWSPPAYMKTTNSVVHGSLLPSYYSAYATYLASAATSIGLDYVSLQNEPDWDPEYECCTWNGSQFHDFCYSNAPAIGRPIVMPEAVHFNDSLSDPTLNDPVACSHIAVMAGHFYGGGNTVHANAISKGKPVWETEHYLDGVRTNWNTCITSMSKEIHDAMNNQFSAYFWWWVNDGQWDNLVDSSGTIYKSGYTIGQFAKFVRPGYYRIGTTTFNTSLDITAYKDGASSNYAIVVLNRGSAPVTQTFNFNGFPAAIVTPWITSSTQGLARQTSFTNDGTSFVYTIQPSNIVSFAAVAPPWAPTGLSGSAPGGARINLTWNTVSGATNYYVRRSTTHGGPYNLIGNAATTNFSDSTATIGITYYYVVSASNMAGEGANSEEASAAALPAGPTSLIATALSGTQISLAWAPVTGASSYTVKRSVVSGGSYTPLSTGSTATNFTDTIAAGMKYYYVVSATSGGLETVNSPEATWLPYPWLSREIGSTGVAGNSAYLNGVFSITASGADIWGTADAFRYVYVTATGDFSMTARVISVQNIDPWSKAGIMVRDSLTAGSINAFIAVTPGNGVAWQARTSTGGSTTNTATSGLNAPYWVRLVRSGNTFTAYRSPDGITWTQSGSTTLSISSTVSLGLAVTSHNNSSLCAATFDNISGPGWTTSMPPAPPSSLAAIPGIRQVALTWTPVANAASYSVKRAATLAGPYTLLTNLTTTNYTDAASAALIGAYYVISSLNIAGEGTNSAPASVPADAFAPGGLSATPVSSSAVVVSWKAFPNASSYNLKRSTSSGGTYATIATGLTTTNYTDSVAGNLRYYYVVSAILSGVETPDSPEATFQLPYPLRSQDIGSVQVTGNADQSNGVFTVTGAGDDIWNAADAFRFVYETAAGDCTMVARVVSLENINAWSKAGLMIRDSLAANAVNVFIAVTPGNGVAFQYRPSTGSNSVNTYTTGLNAPYWVKLVRSGNTFTGYRSPDGITWTQAGTTNLTISASAYVGLAVTSHNSSSPCMAKFDNVMTPNWPVALPPAPDAPTNLVALAGDARINLSWSAPTGAVSYKIKRSMSSSGPFTNLINVAMANYTDTGLSNGFAYYYVVSALNASGESANSAQATAKPLASPRLSVTLAHTNLVFVWPLPTRFSLQSRTNLNWGAWETISNVTLLLTNGMWQVTLPAPNGADSLYYRLMK